MYVHITNYWSAFAAKNEKSVQIVMMVIYIGIPKNHIRAGSVPLTQSTIVLSCQMNSPLTPVSGGSRAAYTTASAPLKNLHIE